MKLIYKIALILLALFALFVIIVWPMAPLWQKLGFESRCIQGSWPNIKLVVCSEAAAPVSTVPLPTPGPDGAIPIIVDDDGSPDGMIALLFFLRSPRVDVRAVTISYGEAHPEIFAPRVAQMLASLGRADIPVGYGSDDPLVGANAFPDPWRQRSNAFWGVRLPEVSAAAAPRPAVELIAETIIGAEKPVTVFVSGSHTNLAEALRKYPAIAGNIRDVVIMGGSIEVPGNIHSAWPELENELAEWNIWVDPQSASQVFSSGLPLHLVPLDATRHLVWTRKDLPGWKAGGAPESQLAAALVESTLDYFPPEGVNIWDLVAAVQATYPEACPEDPLPLEVVTTTGPEEGRTRVVEQAANVAVCLNPDAAMIKALVLSTFQQP